MWYRIKLGACDAGKDPVVIDGMTLTGSDLEMLLHQVLEQLAYATDGTRQTWLYPLRGVLHVGLQIEVWASLKSCFVCGSEGEDYLRVIQRCAMSALSSGDSSRPRPTQMGPLDCRQN